MTDREDEDRTIEHWKKARAFNPKSVSDWLDMFMKSGAFVVMVLGGMSVAIPYLAPEWAAMPENVKNNTLAVNSLNAQLSRSDPQVVDFLGGIIAPTGEVRAGDTIPMAMMVRRNVSCATIVRVRFFDHGTNTIASRYSYSFPAVKAPVSSGYSPFVLQLLIPDDMRPGRYSYLAELTPLDCGVYGPIPAPMSEAFEVIA